MEQDCAAAINQLSGGSKAHWLRGGYSSAFLVRPAGGGVVIEADAMEIATGFSGPVRGRDVVVAHGRCRGGLVRGGAASAPVDFVHNRISARLRAGLANAATPSGRRVRLALILQAASSKRCSPMRRTSGKRGIHRSLGEVGLRGTYRRAGTRGLILRLRRLPPSRGKYKDLTDAEARCARMRRCRNARPD